MRRKGFEVSALKFIFDDLTPEEYENANLIKEEVNKAIFQYLRQYASHTGIEYCSMNQYYGGITGGQKVIIEIEFQKDVSFITSHNIIKQIAGDIPKDIWYMFYDTKTKEFVIKLS